MRAVRPYGDLGPAAPATEMGHQIIEGHRHVLLAQVPSRCLGAIHGAVNASAFLTTRAFWSALKYSSSLRILRSRLSHRTALLKLHNAGDRGVAAGPADAAEHAVAARVIAEVIEAGVLGAYAIPRPRSTLSRYRRPLGVEARRL